MLMCSFIFAHRPRRHQQGFEAHLFAPNVYRVAPAALILPKKPFSTETPVPLYSPRYAGVEQCCQDVRVRVGKMRAVD